MKFSYSQTLGADVDTVLKMFTDPEYHEKLQAALGSMNVTQLAHSDDGDQFSIKLGYQVESDLPGFAKKIIGDTTNVEQTETWDRGSRTGTVDVSINSLPGTLRCKTSLSEDGDSTIKTFDWEVNVKVPLVGGKLEKLVAEDINAKDPIEAQAANDLLDGYR